MSRDEDTIIAEAAAWHAASLHDDMDWDGFTLWLEADPRHNAVYEELALADAVLAEHRDTLRAAPDAATEAANDSEDSTVVRPIFGRWQRWAGAAIAASLVAVLAIPQFLTSSQAYHTGAASQTIALADGSQVILAPRSSLTIEGRGQDHMMLEGGAWFDIRHNPSRTLQIDAGGVTVGDIGTTFDIQASGGQTRIEVGTGQVFVTGQALSAPIKLAQGRVLVFDGKAGTALVAPVATDAIGEWRSGRLSFDSAPLALVAADLSRYAGVQVTVPAALGERQFSGTLVIGNGEAALRDLSQLMDLELGRGAGGYRLGARR